MHDSPAAQLSLVEGLHGWQVSICPMNWHSAMTGLVGLSTHCPALQVFPVTGLHTPLVAQLPSVETGTGFPHPSPPQAHAEVARASMTHSKDHSVLQQNASLPHTVCVHGLQPEGGICWLG